MTSFDDPRALACRLISRFGSHYQTIIFEHYSSEGNFLKIYTEELQEMVQMVQSLKRPIDLGGQQPQKKSYIKSWGSFLWGSGDETAQRVQKLSVLLLNVKREVDTCPPLEKHREVWEECQKHQENLSTHLFHHLEEPDRLKLLEQQGVCQLLQDSVTPYLFNTAAIFTPRGPVFWGSLILEWGFSHHDVEALAQGVLKLHPNNQLILHYRMKFLPDREILPYLHTKLSVAWSFRNYLILRTLDAFDRIIGSPLHREVKKTLFDLFKKFENVRMDVSFELGYHKKLLTEELSHSNPHSQKILQSFRLVMNIWIGHIAPGTPGDDPYLQTLTLWAFQSKGNLVGGIASHDYPYTLQELARRKGYPDQALLPKQEKIEDVQVLEEFEIIEGPVKKEEAFREIPEIKYSPKDLVEIVEQFLPFYEDPHKKNGETFTESALSLLTTCFSVSSVEGREFLIECFKHPLIKISTRQAVDFLTEQGDKKSFEEERELLESISKLLSDRFQVPSFPFFGIFITRYHEEKCSFEIRKKRVEIFFNFIRDRSQETLTPDSLFKGLHGYLRGNQICEVIQVFETVLKVTVDLEELFSFEEFSSLPEGVDVNSSEFTSHAQVVSPYLKRVADYYSFKTVECFSFFFSSFVFFGRPERIGSYCSLFEKFKDFVKFPLPRSEVYKFLRFPMSHDNAEVFFFHIFQIIESLNSRQKELQRQGNNLIVEPAYVELTKEALSELRKLQSLLPDQAPDLSYFENSFLFALFPTAFNFHLRSFPQGIQGNGELKFPRDSLVHAFLPIRNDCELYRKGGGWWEKKESGFSYHFVVLNTHTQKSFFQKVDLDLSADLLRKEPELLGVLKELCRFSYSDTSMTLDPTCVAMPGTLDSLLAFYPSAQEIWEMYWPRSPCKQSLEKPLFDFLSTLKIASRCAFVDLTMRDREEGDLQVTQGRMTRVSKKGEELIYSIGSPLGAEEFSFYATQEPLGLLEMKIRKFLSEDFGQDSSLIKAASQEIIPVPYSEKGTVVYTCLPTTLETSPTSFPYYSAVEDLAPFIDIVMNQVISQTSYARIPVDSVQLHLLRDHMTPFSLSQCLLTFSRNEEKKTITLTLTADNFAFPLAARREFDCEELSDKDNVEQSVGRLVAQFKSTFYKNRIHYAGLQAQEFHVDLKGIGADDARPPLFFGCTPKRVKMEQYRETVPKFIPLPPQNGLFFTENGLFQMDVFDKERTEPIFGLFPSQHEEANGVELSFSAHYNEKVVETRLIYPELDLLDSLALKNALRYSMALLKIKFYRIHSH